METKIEEVRNENVKLGVSGLGGWLVLVQIGLYGTLILLLIQILQNNIYTVVGDGWEILTSESSLFYDPLWKPIILFEMIYNTLFFVFTIFILVQFYRKKTMVPRLMIIFYSLSLLVGIISYILIQQISIATDLDGGSSLKSIIQSIITCLIWIPYFLKSERVENTFIK